MSTKFKVFLKKEKIVNIGIFLTSFLLFFTALYSKKEIINISVISHDQMTTAMEWLKGNFLWLGPEAPYAKQHLPGPLMYFLLFPPLLISKTPYASSIVWLIAWISMTFATTLVFIKTICKNTLSPLLFLLFIFNSPFLFHYLLEDLWQNIFSIFFHLLVLISFYNWKKRNQDAYLCLLGIVMGLGVQIHYSILLHLITLAAFLLTDERLHHPLELLNNMKSNKTIKYKPFPWKYFLAFLIFFLLPQVPYGIALMNGNLHELRLNIRHIITPNFSLNPLNPLNSLKRLKNIFEFMDLKLLISLLPLSTIIYLYKFFRKERIYNDEALLTLFLAVTCPILIAIMFLNSMLFLGLFSIILIIKWHDSLWPQGLSKYILIVFYSVILNLNTFLHLHSKTWTPPPLLNNLIVFIFLCILFYLIYFANTKQKRPLIFLKICLLTLILIPGFYGTTQRRYKHITYHLKRVMSLIHKQTGWASDTVTHRVFSIGLSPGISFSFSYFLAMEEKNKSSSKINQLNLKKTKNKYHGYFIIMKKDYVNFQKIENYLLSKDTQIPTEVKEEILNGSLKIHPIHSESNQWVQAVPYSLESDSMFLESFHNVPVQYKEPQWFQEYCNLTGFFKKDDTFYFCYFFDGYSEKIGASINFLHKNNKNFASIEIIGPPLTVTTTDRFITHHHIKNMKLKLFCSKEETVTLLSHIGLNNIGSEFHKSVFSPVKIRKPINCHSKHIEKILIQFEHQRGNKQIKKQSYFLLNNEL